MREERTYANEQELVADGWEIIGREDWKPGVVRLSSRKLSTVPALFRMDYVDAPVRDAAESALEPQERDHYAAVCALLTSTERERDELRESNAATEMLLSECREYREVDHKTIATLRARVAGLERELSDVRHALNTDALRFIEREGYRRCDIPACNCGSWHGGNMRARFDEIHDLLVERDVETNGKTLLSAVRGVLEDRDAARALMAVERAEGERLRAIARTFHAAIVDVLKVWTFDDGQRHTHTWHTREDWIERHPIVAVLDTEIDDVLRALAQPRAERET